MSNSSIVGLINNAALLLALCLLYDMLGFSLQKRKTLMQEIISGVVLGVIGLAIMANPWNFGQGVVFDTRSVLLAVSGFFFGTIPVAVAMLFTGVFRFLSGGAGMWTGLGVILTSGIIGLLWRHLRPPKHQKPSSGELYLLGVAVHLAMLAWFFLLPWPLAIDVLGKISLPVMLIYPLAVVILGKLLVMSGQRRQAEQDLIKSEERYRELVESANSIILRRDREGRISFFNEFAQRFFGYSAEEILGKNVVGTIVPETDSAGRDLGKMIREITLRPQDYMTNENENILRNGKRVRITWTNKPIFDASGEVVEILCVGNDVTAQRQAQEAAREATLRMQEVVRAANVGLWEWNLATNGIRSSPEWKRQIGYEKHEIADSLAEWQSRVHPDDLAPTLARIRAAIEAREPAYQVEFRFRHRDGSYRWIMASSSVIVDHNGEAVRVMGSHIDITERRQAEQMLRESEEKFRSLAESSPDYIMRYDRDCRHTYMNPAALAVSGVTETDIIGKTHLECGFSEDLSHLWEEKITQVFETGKPSQTEFSWESVNGMVHLDWRLTPEFDADNRVMSVLGVSRDITDRKLAENELRELEERFRLTFYTSPDAININKMDGTYFEINEGFSQLTGFTREDVIGKTSAEISIWDIPEDRERLVEGLQRDGFVKNLESRFLMKDGSCKIALMSAVIIQLKGEPHILSITRDITSFKKTEEDKLILERQLQQAHKMESVGRLAGGVAHDFNNMLGVILGHAELAMEELDPSQPIFVDLQQIKQAANRSTDITRQLLAFARKQIVTPKVIDLNETVAGMLKMLLRLIGEDIDLAWLPGKGLWPIKIDPSQIDQILANLCVNARDAIAGVGRITVGTGNCTLEDEYCSAHAGFVPGQYVKIEVSDNGSGMDKETIPYIFEPFFTTKGVNEGTGLGLATIYGIVKQNKGFINVYSEPEQGTTFTMYLPRHVGTENQGQLDTPAGPTLRGNETLLVVEDEPTILNMTTTMLQRLGYKVLGAGTPGEAIRLADDHAVEIHLLLTDVIMPEMNGRLLAEKLLADRPEMKCLFMSGYTANVISHHGVLEDGVNFIQKPFAKRELAAKIRQALGNG